MAGWTCSHPQHPEDAGVHESHGLLAGRFCSVGSSQSPCRQTPTRCYTAVVAMDGKGRALISCSSVTPAAG